jgi:hypothetical protein
MTNLELIRIHSNDCGPCSIWRHCKQVSTTYDQIIAKEWDIVPDLLHYLELYDAGMHVMFLLMEITKEMPYKPSTPGHWNVTLCRESWIEWGKIKYSKMSTMDKPIESSIVYGKECNGCVRHKRDIMVTFHTEPEKGSGKKVEFNDFFLTNEQAATLMLQLQEVLLRNTEPN